MAATRILFVCMGNICRSPAAEGVMKHLAERRGLSDRFDIDSAGTIGYHAGDPADSRMRAAAASRGIELTSLARRVVPADLDSFDLVIAMDRDNLFHLHSLDNDGARKEKIRLMLEWHPDTDIRDVPDPYYGGADGFETVLDLLEVACGKLLDELEKR